jgi:hypothetical protein
LAGYLMHPDVMLGEHARWAISEIGGAIAELILELDQSTARPIGK